MTQGGRWPLPDQDADLREAASRTATSIQSVQTRMERELIETRQGLQQAVLDMQESLSLLHATLESSPDGVVVVDRQFHIRIHNARFADMWRLPGAVLAEQSLSAVEQFQGEQVLDGGYFHAICALTSRTLQPNMSHVFTLRDGRVFERRVSPQVVQDQWVGTVYNWRDVTSIVRDQRDLREGRERLKAVFDNTFSGLLMLDNRLRVLQINPEACRVLGVETAEVMGKSLLDFVTPVEGHQVLLDLSDKVLLEGGARGRLEIKRGPGVRRLVDYQVSTHILQGLHLVVMSDITEQHAADQLRITHDIVAQASRNKSAFLSRMNHELRTPMTAIMGYSDLLLIPGPRGLTADQRAKVEHIRRAGQHLLNIVDELVDISRIEQGDIQLRFEPVDVSDLVEDARRQISVLAHKHAVTVNLAKAQPADSPPWTTDPTRVLQILLNLLSNAVKYNRPGGCVTLGWRLDGGNIVLCVSDDGLGMSPEQMDRLFTPFDRLGRERSNVPGTGVGLIITRKLLDVLGGSLTVRSVVNEGTEFCARLPLQPGGE